MTAKKFDENVVAQNIKDIIENLGVSATIEVARENSTYFVDIASDDSSLLIGKHGVNLDSLQFALAVRLKTLTGQEDFEIFVDVNNWRRQKETKLKEMAKNIEDKVAETRKEEALFNLSPSERRVIHTYLGESEKVVTESQGEGADRHLIIKPKS